MKIINIFLILALFQNVYSSEFGSGGGVLNIQVESESLEKPGIKSDWKNNFGFDNDVMIDNETHRESPEKWRVIFPTTKGFVLENKVKAELSKEYLDQELNKYQLQSIEAYFNAYKKPKEPVNTSSSRAWNEIVVKAATKVLSVDENNVARFWLPESKEAGVVQKELDESTFSEPEIKALEDYFNNQE